MCNNLLVELDTHKLLMGPLFANSETIELTCVNCSISCGQRHSLLPSRALWLECLGPLNTEQRQFVVYSIYNSQFKHLADALNPKRFTISKLTHHHTTSIAKKYYAHQES